MMKWPLTMKLLVFVAMLVWSRTAAAQTNPFFAPLRAGQLMGMKVEDTDGGKVGTVRNLVLDLRDGKLKYVIVGSGGFVGVHATLKAVPTQAISAATAKSQTLAVSLSTPQWNHAPIFKSANLAVLAEPDQGRAISQYFNTTQKRPAAESEHSLSATGPDIARQTNAPAALIFASDLIGMRVVNDKQEKIGEVMDLLVRFGQPRPAFVIMSSGRLFHRGNEFAVPLNAFSESRNRLILNADSALFERAPVFNRQDWESDGTNGLGSIYRFSKTHE